MAYQESEHSETGNGSQSSQTLQINGDTLELPDSSFIRDAEISRDGSDLILENAQGEVIIEGYFAAADAPTLLSPDGAALTPELVESFAKSPAEYAQSASLNDVSPIGTVSEMSGDATITRTDGSSETMRAGMDIFQGDIVETGTQGALNITFSDESSFAVSEDTRLAIDEYVYDASTQSGAQNFSVLKGVFVFTSGLIGRDDPDDVEIDTPMGSIGIRGTIIAGDATEGEITVVEGAIVLRNPSGFEMTLANQLETAKFSSDGTGITNLGQLAPQQVMEKFSGVSNVSPSLFSSINDMASESNSVNAPTQQNNEPNNEQSETQQDTQTQAPAAEDAQDFDANGATDQNGDNQVDGTLEGAAKGTAEGGPEQTIESLKGAEATDTQTDTSESMDSMNAKMVTKFGVDNSGMETDSGMEIAEMNASDERAADMTAQAENAAESMNTITQQNAQSNTDENLENADYSSKSTDSNVEVLDPIVWLGGTTTNFGINIQWNSINENTTTPASGTVLGTVFGIGAQSFNAEIFGLGSEGVTLVRTSATTYDIVLNEGETLNFETMQDSDVTLVATNALGQSITRVLQAEVVDVQEPVIALDINAQGTPNSYFQGTSGQNWSYNFSEAFTDQDLGGGTTNGIQEVLTYELAASTIDILNGNAHSNNGADISAFITSWNFDTSTGTLDIKFSNSTPWNSIDDSLYIEVTASDTGGNTASLAPILYELNGGTVNTLSGGLNFAFGISGTGGSKIYTTSSQFSGDIENSNNLEIFTSNSDDEINVFNSQSINVLSGDGNDIVNTYNLTDNSEIITGYGDDSVILANTSDTSIHTMQGNDIITIDSAQLSGMQDNSLSNVTIDAGSNDEGPVINGNGDVLALSSIGNIDFSALGSNEIRNIEVLSTNNNTSNEIILNYNDVIALTDNRNTLVLDADSNDSVYFDAQSLGGDAQVDATYEFDGETYDVYNFDDVTLVIDQDASVTITA